MFCESCGKQINENSKFCKFCGASTALTFTQAPESPSNVTSSAEDTTITQDKSERIEKLAELAELFNTIEEEENEYNTSRSLIDLKMLTISYSSAADLLLEIGKHEEALTLYQTLINAREVIYNAKKSKETLKDLAFSYEDMMICLEELGRMDEAEEYRQMNITTYKKAVEMDDDDDEVSYQVFASASPADTSAHVPAESSCDDEDDDDEDYLVFAYWPKDGCFYPATIEARYTDGTVDLEYMDGARRNAHKSELIPLKDAFAHEDLQGNWEKGGTYYACKIHRIVDGGDVEVIYKMDGVFEKISIAQLRIKVKKKGGLFGRR